METVLPASSPAPRTCDATDISTMCLNCGTEMQPEHAHYRCRACGSARLLLRLTHTSMAGGSGGRRVGEGLDDHVSVAALTCTV